jgi:UDP-glucose 4-epimerase
VVQAFVSLLTQPERTQGSTFNVGTGQQTSVNALYREIARLVGSSQVAQYLPPKAGELRHNALAWARLHKATGWAPHTSLREGLQKTVAAFQAQQSQPSFGKGTA